jgi:hypothetical protein
MQEVLLCYGHRDANGVMEFILMNLVIGFVTYPLQLPKAFGTLALTQSFGISSSH